MTKNSIFYSFDTILFDFDGTLVASEMVHLACWQMILRPFAAKLDEPLYRKLCYGSTIFDSADALCKHFNLAISAEELAKNKSEQLMRQLPEIPFQPMPGAQQMLAMLKQNGVQMALVTGSRKPEVDLTLATLGWDELLSHRITLEDVSAGKPAPDGFRLAMRELGVTPERCIAVEDSATGMASAIAAELPTYSVHATLEQQRRVPGVSGHFETLKAFAKDVLALDIDDTCSVDRFYGGYTKS